MPPGERSSGGDRPPGFDARFLEKWREHVDDRCGIEFDLVRIVDGDLLLEYQRPPPDEGPAISDDVSCIISFGFEALRGLAEYGLWTPDRVYVTVKCPDWGEQNTWYFTAEWARAWYEGDLSDDEIERRVKEQQHPTEML